MQESFHFGFIFFVFQKQIKSDLQTFFLNNYLLSCLALGLGPVCQSV